MQVLLSMIESYVSVQRFCFKSLYVSTMCLIADMETIPQMKSAGTPEKSRLPALLRAGDERIELPLRVLETPVIPFDQSPILYSVQDAKKHPFRCIPVPSKPHISPHSILLSYPPLCFPLQGRSTHYARKNLAKFLEQASY